MALVFIALILLDSQVAIHGAQQVSDVMSCLGIVPAVDEHENVPFDNIQRVVPSRHLRNLEHVDQIGSDGGSNARCTAVLIETLDGRDEGGKFHRR